MLKGAAAFVALGASPAPSARRARGAVGRPRVVVIGAGAFGGWTALHLVRRGARVVLVDSWGPGNSRASSGGETRVIRAIYGAEKTYVEMAARALRLWKENEPSLGRPLLHLTGVLWMTGDEDRLVTPALPLLRDAGLPTEEIDLKEASRRYPRIDFDGIRRVVIEKEAGYLLARRACQAVMERFLSEGGEFRTASVEPGSIVSSRMEGIRLSDGTLLEADQYVFACGPWIGRLFPDVIGDRVLPSRQEVFFFGTPAGDRDYLEERLPIWIDSGRGIVYGIPGNEWRGFKFGDDTHGPLFDPTGGDRRPSARGLRGARAYLARRFPGLADAPLLEARVCQYENTRDSRFIIDRHPLAANVVLAGGGSGHGFKHGPVVGERVADLVLGGGPADPFFALSRTTL